MYIFKILFWIQVELPKFKACHLPRCNVNTVKLRLESMNRQVATLLDKTNKPRLVVTSKCMHKSLDK